MTIEELCTDIQLGYIDPNTLKVHIDCGDFSVLNSKDEEVVGGDERDVLPQFFKLLGIPVQD